MKRKRLPSFRMRVLGCFGVFHVILVCWILAYAALEGRSDKIKKAYYHLEELRQQFSDNNRALSAFLLNGYRTESFYTTGQEVNIDSFLTGQQQLNDSLAILAEQFDRLGLNVAPTIQQLRSESDALQNNAVRIKHLILQRGFIDHGIEGQMRRAAHQIENGDLISKPDILQLRRHEKDFLLRHKLLYVELFDRLLNDLINRPSTSAEAKSILQSYGVLFRKLAVHDQQIGISDGKGLYNEIQRNTSTMEGLFSGLSSLAKRRLQALSGWFQLLLWAATGIAVLIAFSASLLFATSLTKDLTRLNQKILALRRNRFSSKEVGFTIEPKTKEVANLHHHFEILMKELGVALEEMVEERDKAREISEYKGLFLANMSHEIRTPLNGVTGMAHLLKSTELDETQKQYMEVIEYSANHLISVVNMILDYSKLDASSMKLEKMEFDLHGDLKKLIKIFELRAAEKGVNIQLNLLGDTRRYIKGDSLRLQQVLINLIDNALKFTNSGEVSVTVTEVGGQSENQKLRFEINDTGIGIPAEKLDRLFGAFEQLDGSVTRKYGGTGLGLTISAQLVQLMGGELCVDSSPGEGSTFYFEVEFEQGSVKPTYDFGRRSSEFSHRNLRVLVAEDNKVNQAVIAKMLQKLGVEVLLADNGAEAVEKFHNESISMIFMDIQMPVMDGLEATSTIRTSQQYDEQPFPIIAITANAFEEDRRKAFEAGMDDFLAKPVRPFEIEGVIAKFSSRRSKPDHLHSTYEAYFNSNSVVPM